MPVSSLPPVKCHDLSSTRHRVPSFVGFFRRRLKRTLSLEIHSIGVPRKALADEIGWDEPKMSRILSDSCPDEPPMSSLPALTATLGPGLLKWLNAQCGDGAAQSPIPTDEIPILAARLAGLAGSATSEILSGRDPLKNLQALRHTVEGLISRLDHP